MIKGISDDEGDDLPVLWKKERLEVSDATAAIAVKWQRTARARLQKVGTTGRLKNDYFKYNTMYPILTYPSK